jgi:hypothetical protein
VEQRVLRSMEAALWRDTAFLSALGVMDYSLLVGVDKERNTLVVAIIDFIRWGRAARRWAAPCHSALPQRPATAPCHSALPQRPATAPCHSACEGPCHGRVVSASGRGYRPRRCPVTCLKVESRPSSEPGPPNWPLPSISQPPNRPSDPCPCRQYTWDKQLETWVKSSGILGGNGKEPTIISPKQYCRRFRWARPRPELREGSGRAAGPALPAEWSSCCRPSCGRAKGIPGSALPASQACRAQAYTNSGPMLWPLALSPPAPFHPPSHARAPLPTRP